MKSPLPLVLAALLGLAPITFAQTLSAAPAATHVDASAPIAKTGASAKHFLEKHEEFLARGKAGPIGVLWLGDSITENWSKAPDTYNQYYGDKQPANFGIGGDTTQNVVWRIANGELDGIHPKVVIFMLGTNNSSSHSADEIFDADKKIITQVREKTGAKVLLLAIFPRGPRTANKVYDSGVERMKVINAVNAKLASLDDGVNIRYLDIGHVFLGPDGRIPDAIMPDQLHPSPAGYKLEAAAIQPLLTEMYGK